MARNDLTAHPSKRLTDAGWAVLHTLIQHPDIKKAVSAETLCKALGVSKQAYYLRYPVRKVNGATGAPVDVQTEAA